MFSAPAQAAKITPPRVGSIVERKRLFQALDRARKRRVVWVSGPPGAGKTTLVASYLANRPATTLWYAVDASDDDASRFLHYLSLAAGSAPCAGRSPSDPSPGEGTAAREYFEDLYARLRPPFAIVLDDFHAVREDSRLHDVIEAAVATLPEDGTLMVVSRRLPSKRWARLRASQAVAEVGCDQLRLTDGEAKRLLRLRRVARMAPEQVDAFHEWTHGWVAGAVLLLDEAETAGASHGGNESHGERNIRVPPVIFDYFARELFDGLPEATQDFLLQLAVVPRTTVSQAVALTGREDAGKTLVDLVENHYFTERDRCEDPRYRFHPLFRAFLLRLGEEVQPADVRARLHRTAGALAEEAGLVEEAAALYRRAGEWPELVRLICARAPILVAEGQTETLVRWIADLPDGLLETVPWLGYWLAVCQPPGDASQARRAFEAAFAGFAADGDRLGCVCAVTEVMEAIICAGHDLRPLDPWIERLTALVSDAGGCPSPEVEGRVVCAMLGALSLRRPDHAEVDRWVAHAHRLLHGAVDRELRVRIGLYLVIHHLWQGEWAEAVHVVDILRTHVDPDQASRRVRVLWEIMERHVAWYVGGRDGAPGVREIGSEISPGAHVGTWDVMLMDVVVAALLGSGEVERAAALLERMRATVDASGQGMREMLYYRDHAWEATLRGDVDPAVRSAEIAVQLGTELGAPVLDAFNRYILAQALLEAGRHQEAARRFGQVRRFATRLGSSLLAYMVELGDAQLAFASGNVAQATRHLGRGLQLSRRRGYTVFVGCHPRAMADLCTRALELGVEVGRAQELITRCHLLPVEPPVTIDTWPWPVRIHTLGRFSTNGDGRPRHSSGKAPSRPLDLLRTLIGFGGKEVSEVELADALWPDANGDDAHRTFATTLHRLRKLLGHDDAIELRGGRLSLNPWLCWLDVWAFEALTAGVRSMGHDDRAQAAGVVARLERALQLYEGPFLVGEQGAWVLFPRERLRSLYLRTVTVLGHHWQAVGSWERAITTFEMGLAVDDLAEGFYQRLICCYQQQGRRAEALAVYYRCRETLAAVLEVEPSPGTERLYRQLRA